MTAEEIKLQIKEKEEELKKLKKDLYAEEHKVLFDEMINRIGKCYRSKRFGTGENHIIMVDDVNKRDKCYMVNDIHYMSMLIGWDSLSISYSPLFYDKLTDDLWEEIPLEQFMRIAKNYIHFATENLDKKYKEYENVERS